MTCIMATCSESLRTQSARGRVRGLRPGPPLPVLHCPVGFAAHSPEHHGVVGVTGGGEAGHSTLRGKAGLHEGPWVEHAQETVDDDLGMAVETSG
jgi:hypothetical protein